MGLPEGFSATGISAPFAPGYAGYEDDGVKPIGIDGDGALSIRGPVLTDEGSFRTNFPNTELDVSIGTCGFVNGSDKISGEGFLLTDLHIGDYVWSASDTYAAGVQVVDFNDTEITLLAPYGGSTGVAVGRRQYMKQVVGAGSSLAISSANAVVTHGTTTGSVFELKRLVDYMPLSVSASILFASRIANQTSYFGAWEDMPTQRFFAYFVFDGTTNTSVKCVTGRNPSGTPSAAEQQSTTVTISATTSAQDFRIDIFNNQVSFWVADVLKATHKIAVPHPADVFTVGYRNVNGTSPAANSATLAYINCRNYNALDTVPVPNLPQPVIFDATATLPTVTNVTTCATVTNVTGYTAASTSLPATTHHLISANTTNATNVKASAGNIYGGAIANNGAANAYFKVYNKASAPTVGTDTPIATLLIPPSRTLYLASVWPLGCRLSTGISYALTTGMAVADTAAVAAAQCSVHLNYV